MCKYCENFRTTNKKFDIEKIAFNSEDYVSMFYFEKFITGHGNIVWYLHNVIHDDLCDDYAIQIEYCPFCGKKLK